MQRILVIEDDVVILRLLTGLFAKDGFQVETSEDGRAGMARIRSHAPDLLVLDLGFPGMPGLEILQEIRSSPQLNQLPVVVLTVRGDEADAELGLELGADDYVIKPFRPRELAARVRGLIRKAHRVQGAVNRLKAGELVLDADAYQVFLAGSPVPMSSLEFRLLHFLMSNQGKGFPRERLLDEAWGKDHFVTPRSVDTYMWRLRKRIEKDLEHPLYLRTVRGFGYVFHNPDAPGLPVADDPEDSISAEL